jgi:hypothetical protein
MSYHALSERAKTKIPVRTHHSPAIAARAALTPPTSDATNTTRTEPKRNIVVDKRNLVNDPRPDSREIIARRKTSKCTMLKPPATTLARRNLPMEFLPQNSLPRQIDFERSEPEADP